MEIAFKLVTLCTLVASLTNAQLNYNNPIFVPEYIQTQSSIVAAVQQPPPLQDQIPDNANINFQQLPNPEIAQPFYTESQPSTYLKAPTEDASVTNNFNAQLYPNIPSQDLQVPSLVKWNPNEDPNLYYPVVIEKIVPLNIPTNQYPKKYNKNLQKIKPSGFKPKDVVLIDDIIGSEKDIDKALFTLAKQENRKQLELENIDNQKVKESVKDDTVPAESIFGHHGISSVSNSLSDASSAFTGFPGVGGHGGDRMEFHIQGHAGPKSYKWGYDTGKGKNRHFRFEERDTHGFVKGHYGYYDKHGKLRMVHYDSHPHEGFHASDNGFGPN